VKLASLIHGKTLGLLKSSTLRLKRFKGTNPRKHASN
jgi:hypothetical protein